MTLMILFFIQGVLALEIKKVAESIEKCKGPYSLTSKHDEDQGIKLTSAELTMRTAPPEVKVLAVRVTRTTLYCKDGFTSIGSTACEHEEKAYSLGHEDMIMGEKGKCLVGQDCRSGECTGSMSTMCQSDLRNIQVNEMEPRQLRRDVKMIFYNCLSTWSCRIRQYQIAPHTKEGSDAFFFRGVNHEEVPLQEEFYGSEWNYFIRNTSISTETKNVSCLGSKQTLLCEYSKSPSEYVLIENGKGRDRNVLIGGVVHDGWGDLSALVSLDEMKHILQKLITVELKSRHNEIQISKKLSSIQSQILWILKKRPDCAIEELLGFRIIEAHGGYLLCPSVCSEDSPWPALNVNKDPDLIKQITSVDPVIDEATTVSLREHFKRMYSDSSSPNKTGPSGNNWFDFLHSLIDFVHSTGSWCGLVSLTIIVLRFRA